MKNLVIPDLHENLDFLKYILAVEDTAQFDRVVMLGDYFDPPRTVNPSDDNLKRVAGTILGMKEILGDKLVPLCGNHDLPYYALRPICGSNKGRPNRIIANWLSNTTCERAEVINQLWDEAFWKSLKGSVYLDGWLFSHAGVHPDWWNPAADSSEARARHLDWAWREAFDAIFEEDEHPIFAAGIARGGALPFGGPLWLDWEKEFKDVLEVPQIVGHTRCAQPTQKGTSYCIDFAQAAYAIVENGELQLKIWPDSWLGKESLDSV